MECCRIVNGIKNKNIKNSLWTLLASNMLIGCDLAQLDDFTISLLCNNEVNAVNQDILGRQAERVVEDGSIHIFKRRADGTAVGIAVLGRHELGVQRHSQMLLEEGGGEVQ